MTADVEMTPAQIQALLVRLEDAEETLRAIRHGEVDGLVVVGPQGDQVFTLKGADHPYRVMIEAMEEGAATLGADGTILFCNRRFASLLRLSHAQVLGVPLARFLAAESQHGFTGLTAACRDGHAARGEIELVASDGTVVPVSLACSILSDDATESLCIVATDLTARYAAEAEIRQLNQELEARVEARTAELAQANAALRDEIAVRLEADTQLCFQAQILDKIGQAVIATDLTMTVRYWNPAAEQLYGWSSAEAIGQNAFELISPQASYEQGQAIMAALRRGESWRGEYLVQDRRGRTFPVDAADSPFFAEDGTLVGIIGVSHDITARKQAEEALQESQRQFAALIQNVESGVALIDTQGQFTIVNPMFLRLFGLADTPDNILNINSQDWSAWQVFDEDGVLLPVDEHPVRKAVLTSRTVRNQLVGMRLPSGGNLVWMLVSAEPILKPEGGLEQLICTYHDISEFIRAEAALYESEERYRTLFSGMTEGFALHEIITDEHNTPVDYRFLDLNPAFERLTGLQREDVIGNSLHDVLPTEDPEWVRRYGAVALTGESLQFEHYSAALNRHYDVLAYRPAPRQFAVIFMDVTERKQAEEALRESEKQFRRIVETTNEGILLADSDGKIRFANQRMAQMLGYTVDELVGKMGVELVVDDEEIDKAHEMTRKRQEGIKEHYEIRMQRKDGGDVWLLASGTPVHDEEGRHIGNLGMYADITERKRAEAEIQRHADELRVANEELSRFNRVAVGRELRMIELKKEINALYAAAGQPPRYRTDFEEGQS